MEKEKPYKCDVCHKRYKNLNGLKYHKTHSPPCNPELQQQRLQQQQQQLQQTQRTPVASPNQQQLPASSSMSNILPNNNLGMNMNMNNMNFGGVMGNDRNIS